MSISNGNSHVFNFYLMCWSETLKNVLKEMQVCIFYKEREWKRYLCLWIIHLVMTMWCATCKLLYEGHHKQLKDSGNMLFNCTCRSHDAALCLEFWESPSAPWEMLWKNLHGIPGIQIKRTVVSQKLRTCLTHGEFIALVEKYVYMWALLLISMPRVIINCMYYQATEKFNLLIYDT